MVTMRMEVGGDEEPQWWCLLGCWGFGGALSVAPFCVPNIPWL